MWSRFLINSRLGAGCDLARLKVWILIPATLFLTIIAVIGGRMLGFSWGATALTVIACATGFQFSYLIGAIHSEAPKPRAARVPPGSVRADLLLAIQSVIGQELQNRYEVAQELPWKLRMKAAQIA
jgi:hypothetical protein